MIYRRLGKSGLRLSALSFGSWVTFHTQLEVNAAADCMKVAYDAGVNFFDNAEVYAQGESEIIMGKVLRDMGWGRDTYCVSSKVYWGGQLPTQRGLHKKHVHDACHAALKRLQVDYLDLFFCHRPDLHTPIEETVRTMHTLVEQGKILYWGTSEWDAQQITEAHAVAAKFNLTPPTMEQPQYNMFHRDRVEREYSRLYSEFGMGTTIWSPLASGILTGKYSNGIPAGSRATLPGYEWLRQRFESEEGRTRIEKTRKLEAFSKELGTSVTKLAIAWCLANSNVSTVILGASKADQLSETLGALSLCSKLDAGTLAAIEEILDNRPEPLPEF
ncbi:MAG: aldo/keto reductase [Bdellovibrionaceae bacterium]|nr:aldo/keto reductase [Pseudobdellovibrionaceae bacterium]